jgi:hypothetical protein
VLFLVVLFLIKNKTIFQNSLNSVLSNQTNGLTYDSSTTIEDLVNRDTDGDGIPDWEESLYGLDPTKKETTPGIPDSVALEKLKAQNQNLQGLVLQNTGNQGTENLTKTDQFSQDFLATVTTLSQNGQIDSATEDQISNSLADNIQNSPPRKTYLLSDLKIVKDDSIGVVQKYSDALNIIYKNYKVNYTVLDVLQEFSTDANNVDSSVLVKLDPIIKQTQSIIDGMAKMTVPQSLALMHLDVLNGFERVGENLNDIQLYDTDTVIALGGITKYSQNANTLVFNMSKLADTITQKLKK